jgi:hypothetical protein
MWTILSLSYVNAYGSGMIGVSCTEKVQPAAILPGFITGTPEVFKLVDVDYGDACRLEVRWDDNMVPKLSPQPVFIRESPTVARHVHGGLVLWNVRRTICMNGFEPYQERDSIGYFRRQVA